MISTFSLLENPNHVPTSHKTVAASPLIAKDRSPASIPSGITEFPVQVVEWDCHQDRLQLSAVTQVRLRLHPCLNTEKDSLSTKVTNVTTGFAATVFSGGERADMTTDFISLAGGVNRIHIEHVLKNGKHTARELAIVTQ